MRVGLVGKQNGEVSDRYIHPYPSLLNIILIYCLVPTSCSHPLGTTPGPPVGQCLARPSHVPLINYQTAPVPNIHRVCPSCIDPLDLAANLVFLRYGFPSNPLPCFTVPVLDYPAASSLAPSVALPYLVVPVYLPVAPHRSS